MSLQRHALKRALADARAEKDAEIASARDQLELTTKRAQHQWLRAEQAESALATAQARIARLEEALAYLRDYFAYGQREHAGMSAGAAPRCAPSVWNEIRRRVEAALRSTAEEARHE